MAEFQSLPDGRNGILEGLSDADRTRLEPYLEDVPLVPGQVLLEPGQSIRRAYFPYDCFVSMQVEFEEGPQVEAATVGPEGVIGLPVFVINQKCPARLVVRTPGRAATIAGDRLDQAISDSPELRGLMNRYAHAFLTHTIHNVACRSVHHTSERLAKWILMAADRTRGTTVDVTQEILATALGIGRPTVSQVAGALQEDGLIRHRRGRIEILDRPRLERMVCPCYREIRDAYENLIRFSFS